MLARDEEKALYLRHGPPPGNATASVLQPDWSDPVLLEQLQTLRYVESTGAMDVVETPKPLPGGENPLEAGPYVLTARVRNSGPPRRLRLDMIDASGLACSVPAFEVDVPTGEQEVAWRFTKPFAPYDGTLRASADAPGLSIPSWELRPDVDALKRWQPAAAESPPLGLPPETVRDVRYPGIGIWRRIRMPEEISADRPFAYAVRFDLDESIPHRTFHEDQLFLHLRDADGTQVATLDLPLSRGSFTADALNWQTNGPFPAGRYVLDGGLYNVRTGIRAPFTAPEGVRADPKRRTFAIREVVCVPSETTGRESD